MPEFKVVVSDPEAKNPRILWVKVIGVDELKYGEEHKEGRALATAKANPETLDSINAPYGVVTLRIWRDRASNDKVKFTLKLLGDPSVPKGVLLVPKAMLVEKLGRESCLGEVFRAKSFQVVVRGEAAAAFLDKRIGDVVNSSVVGIKGKKLMITGGSDLAGFPMIKTLSGTGKKALLLSKPPGFHPRIKGERRRKYVRGNTISEEIVQINTKIV